MESLLTGSIIMAAGKGSRMKGYEGNKALLPLVPGSSLYDGDQPILLHILKNLPPGPKAIVVNHRKEDVIRATSHLGIEYYEQPVTNGTGGALLAARPFIEKGDFSRMIITMGDVPFVRESTYQNLVRALEDSCFVVLGFRTDDKKRYGVLETRGNHVTRIVEWTYWHRLPREEQNRFQICNSGIYGARRHELLPYLARLESRPHRVLKERKGKMVEIEEFFITDLVELIHSDGGKVGFIVAEDEREVMGLDDPVSLGKAQEFYKREWKHLEAT
ncbi:MAG: NTP transferase domain-containing protein [Deltaproteobacteria bacterium]|nr:NTP transferase domain-containing protein [Deltaproteobacteria bacterium]MBW2016894.1 NTP transferase domain-containing protein [Deltaproteobacteria bacterium]MBW2128481.1 NTP transferase domain-containing protein [Deltaproteobacteria bacterium]MBW2303660.1 NTP transferase domain-containing protein [Deltaproteobacteria bacterium]